MKIIYLLAGTYNSGGMERVLTLKANWLAAHGYEVLIVTTDQRGREPFFPLHPSIRTIELGINYDETNGKSFLSKAISYLRKQRKHRQRLEEVLKKERADITVCMFNNDVNFVYKLKDGSSKVLEIHFSKNKKLQYNRRGLWRLADQWRTWQEERIVRRYDKFVVLTHEDKNLWGNIPNIQVIPNPLPFETNEQADLKEKRVIAVGRLDHQKGFDRLIDIWYSMGDTANGWQLDIIGEGSLRNELQVKINSLRLEHQIRLCGSTSDMQQEYLQSSIVVMTSRYEGFPMVLLEAQAFGIPVVSYACQCGPHDIISDGYNGFLTEEGDNDRFAARLQQLMLDEKLRKQMGQCAKETSKAYAIDNIMPQWEELFRGI